MQSVRSAPSASSSCRYSVRQLRTRAIGSGRRRRRLSTPSPRRVIVSRRVTSSSLSPSTSATRRRVEFVPRSTAATRLIEPGGTHGASAPGAAPSQASPAERRARRRETRRRSVAACRSWFARSASARRRSVRAERSSNSASSLENNFPVRFPCRQRAKPRTPTTKRPTRESARPIRNAVRITPAV